MTVKDITSAIEEVAPLVYQESYDNCGIQVGDPKAEVTGVLLTLDVTEEVLDEAIARNCNMIVAHHPLIFSGLKKLTGRNYVERIVIKAIKNDITIYAAHTNLDNMLAGVNDKIAEKLGLADCRILVPKSAILSKLYTYAPFSVADKVRDAMFAAGAGSIGNYTECSFNVAGQGTFRASADAHPAIGQAGGPRVDEPEVKIEVLVEKHREREVLAAMRGAHIYEEVAYELVPINNLHQQIGAGMIGSLPQAMDEKDFLTLVKKEMKADIIRHTALSGNKVQKVAICGGSGSFLLNDAIAAGADIFITADFKYHQFFDAGGKIVIADIGHYETEQFTPEIFEMVLKKKFINFAVLLSNVLTNPVKYFC